MGNTSVTEFLENSCYNGVRRTVVGAWEGRVGIQDLLLEQDLKLELELEYQVKSSAT